MDQHILRPDQVKEFLEIFDIFRDPGSDRIPIQSLLRVRSDLGFFESEEELRTRVCNLVSPTASTAGLKFHDFLTFVAAEQPPVKSTASAAANVKGMSYDEEMERVFRRLDLNGDGVLDVNEVFAADKRTTANAFDVARPERGGDAKFPQNVAFEDSMEMEDAVLVLDDAARREKQKSEVGENQKGIIGEKYVDSWQEFERAERRPRCYCLKCGGFKEMMQE